MLSKLNLLSVHFRTNVHSTLTSKTKTKFPSRIDYAYTYDVDPMGYQTGNFPKSNYWKDRNDV